MASLQIYSILFLVSNIFLVSTAQYTGVPEASKNLSAIVNGNVSLVCQYTGSGDDHGEFTGWWKDGKAIDDSTPKHYRIISGQDRTELIITFNETDAQVAQWSVRTSKQGWEEPPQCRFKKIKLKSSPRHILTNKKTEKIEQNEAPVRRVVKEQLVLHCINQPYQPKLPEEPRKMTKHKPTVWRYSVKGDTFGKLPSDVQIDTLTQISIESVQKTHHGYYQCRYHNGSLTVFVRVKDPYAALWPFIGIVCTVLVLIVVILIFEKRQKDAKKRAAALANDEANDNANKPLVATSNKLVGDENKKATVNA